MALRPLEVFGTIRELARYLREGKGQEGCERRRQRSKRKTERTALPKITVAA